MISKLLRRTSRPLLVVLPCIFVALVAGCTKDTGDSGSNGGTGGGSGGSGGGGGASGNSQIECGIVFGGDLTYPSLSDGSLVQVVSVLGNNLVVIADKDTGKNRLLVKLQGVGISSTDFKKQQSIERIERLTDTGAVFFKATNSCEVVLGNGARATIGSLLTLSGESVAENLIKSNLGPVDAHDACSGGLNGSCLQQLAGQDEQDTFGELLTTFLWKPISDSNGNLVVLVFECNVRVTVNGEELQYAGSGNGRCSTMRGTKPGCAYGANPVVKVFDADTDIPYTHNGSTEINIPNGCNRFEF